MTEKPDLSVIIPTINTVFGTLQKTVHAIREQLRHWSPLSYEIIVVPNHSDPQTLKAHVEELQDLKEDDPKIIIHPNEAYPGKGAALHAGFSVSRGELILLVDDDLPYDLKFIDDALPHLKRDADLVIGNRRLAQSTFTVPVTLLSLVHRRHRMGIWFNRFVRRLLPIQTYDTQSGIKMMTRALAMRAFEKQTSNGFFFDLELLLVAKIQKARVRELPVHFTLHNEKTTIRLFREALKTLIWVPKIFIQYQKGHYGKELD